MGLFSFMKNAGTSLFGKKKKKAAPTTTTTDKDPSFVEKIVNQQKAEALEDIVRGWGFNVQNLNITVEGDKVNVSGAVNSQEEKEKVILALGNVEGVATVDENITVLAPAEEETTTDNNEPKARNVKNVEASAFYTVKKGDSLSKIAKRQYGNALKYPLIFNANKPMLKDPDLIYPGQVLRIPALDAQA